MSEIAGQTGHRGVAATDIVHESYSFACMRCGHGWEQSYEIEHHLDAEDREFVMYVADGQVVPSPLTRPTCLNCDSHVVRIMRAGQVSSALRSMHQRRPLDDSLPESGSKPEQGQTEAEPETKEHHHWHLSDLLHPFHHRKAS
ncbi:hypothetical protein [Streptomyces sporangiiformans]|uniref:C2H2-type domain-containing protein n=1 Tax=Streptomyces sporangiiformans TaxID=2315329 RepID=A0A505DBV9_9ACTN|nr:hypothetical protein [Streptomyces sporangiiformans]TPQ22013.1 hypothetical protein FGD71_012115 [Streptomyces sporangiiformans]